MGRPYLFKLLFCFLIVGICVGQSNENSTFSSRSNEMQGTSNHTFDHILAFRNDHGEKNKKVDGSLEPEKLIPSAGQKPNENYFDYKFGNKPHSKHEKKWGQKVPMIKNKNQITLLDAIANEGNNGHPLGFKQVGEAPSEFRNRIFDYNSDNDYAMNETEIYDDRGKEFDEVDDELSKDLQDTVNMVDLMDKNGDDNIYDKTTGIGFHHAIVDDEVESEGADVERVDQMIGGIKVDGAGLIVHKYKGNVVWLIDKHTEKKTRQIRLPKTRKIVATVIPRSRSRSARNERFNKADYNPNVAMNKFKELRGGMSITDEVKEVLITNDYGDTPEAVHRVSFIKMGKNPSEPMAIYNTTNNELIEEWDNMEGVALPVGMGPGGNKNTGKWQYGEKNQSKLIVNDMGNGTCSYSTPNVTVIDLKQGFSMRDNETFTYSCYKQESDEINGGYSALNDALYHAELVNDMFKAWYNRPAWKNGVVIKVHYGKGDANARFYGKGKFIYIGDGNKWTFPPTTLQIIAHEIGHGITHETSNLEKRDVQSSALNEIFSDATAMAVERYVFGSNSKVEWKMGKNFFKNKNRQLRCMDNPKCLGDDTYGNLSPSGIDHVKDLKQKGLSEYQIAGIWRKVFYLLSQKYDIWDVYDIFYITNTEFWQQKTKFKQAAQLMLHAVSEMKQGLHSIWDYHYFEIEDVIDAFKQVGINCFKGKNNLFKCGGKNLS